MSKPTPPEIHQRLAQAREEAGFATASDAARRFGWNENTYRSHENGERGLKVDVAYKYARSFRVRFEWLMIGEQSEILFTTESHILSGYFDDDGVIHRYPDEDVGNFKRLVAISSYLSRSPSRLIESSSKKPMLGCWPGDLLIATIYDRVIAKAIIHPGDLALVTLEDGKEILRFARFNDDRSLVDTQLYPEMGPIHLPYKSISIVQCVIKKRSWTCEAMEEWQAQLLDPHRKASREGPSRRP